MDKLQLILRFSRKVTIDSVKMGRILWGIAKMRENMTNSEEWASYILSKRLRNAKWSYDRSPHICLCVLSRRETQERKKLTHIEKIRKIIICYGKTLEIEEKQENSSRIRKKKEIKKFRPEKFGIVARTTSKTCYAPLNTVACHMSRAARDSNFEVGFSFFSCIFRVFSRFLVF